MVQVRTRLELMAGDKYVTFRQWDVSRRKKCVQIQVNRRIIEVNKMPCFVDDLARISIKLTSDPMQSDTSVERRSGTLRHGNPSGDPSKSPRCGAKTRSGKPCRAPAMWSERKNKYTRCRLHGGASTGPRTPEGRARCQMANWRHGDYSNAAKADRRELRLFLQLDRLELRQLERQVRRYLKLEKRTRKGTEQVPLAIMGAVHCNDYMQSLPQGQNIPASEFDSACYQKGS
jgi:hypothetical protein